MIIHVFTANRYQLVPAIAKGFISVFKKDAEQVVLLYGNSSLNKQKYVELFGKEGFTNYAFCSSLSEYMSFIWRHKRYPILFHAGNYYWFLIAWLLGCRKLNWVCWGSGASSPKSLRGRFSLPYKRFLYHRFNSIVTLMDADRDSIIRDFHVSPSKIETISYMSMGDGKNQYDILKEQLMSESRCNSKPVVLLGNNPSCISGYLELLPRMKQYAGRIVVKCMLNYSLVKDNRYDELIRLGEACFGEDFVPSEEFYEEKEEYIRYMNDCDIYICPVHRQSGLGAVNTCLGLGKKVYLTGKNLEWITAAYKARVYDADDINDSLSFEVFTRGLSEEEKRSNYDSVINRRTIHVEKWRKYLAMLDKN